MVKKKRTPHWPSFARGLKRQANETAKKKVRDFSPLMEKAGGIEDPYYRAQALAWIGKVMGQCGKDPGEIFSRAIRSSEKVEPDWRKAEALLLIGAEMVKAGDGDFKPLLEAMGDIEDPQHREKAMTEIEAKMKRKGIKVPVVKIKKMTQPDEFMPPKKAPQSTRNLKRLSLGLVNTYSGKRLLKPHLRAVSRAAPLCYAYGLNLCLFGFPVKEGDRLVAMVKKDSRVGEKENYLMRLHEGGQLLLFNSPERPVYEGIGALVATTSEPVKNKRVSLEGFADNEPYCFLMGLGSQGLPAKALDISEYHLELTGKGIPLETCTAMGALAVKLGELQM